MLGNLIEYSHLLKKKLASDVKDYPFYYFLLIAIILLALFVRLYRLGDLLAFHYDQGRDALVVWRLWHEGRPFLIGPVTGLEGIFLGPFYYYLIAPFYLIGGGNPVVPAVFLVVFSTVSILVIYYLALKIADRNIALLTAFIAAFSLNLAQAARWLSNPTPILLTSSLIFLSFWKIIKGGSKYWWIALSLLLGISLQLESASAVFYLPITIIFIIWRYITQKKQMISVLQNRRIVGLSILFFLLTLVPQILFNFRHENILFNNFYNLFFQEQSFSLSIRQVLSDRFIYFWRVYRSTISPGEPQWLTFFMIFSFAAVLFNYKKLIQKEALQLFLIFFIIPAIGYTLFQGNYGNLYDYYLTGYYMPMVLFFSLGIGYLWKNNYTKPFVVLFLILFTLENGKVFKTYLSAEVDGPIHITLGNQIQAVDWLLDSKEKMNKFNIEIYVPPVIPHSYNYLLTWKGHKRCGADFCGWQEEPVETVYFLFEQDPQMPSRLQNWLDERDAHYRVLDEERYGGITVQKRVRLSNED